jgi:hypothetical protein
MGRHDSGGSRSAFLWNSPTGCTAIGRQQPVSSWQSLVEYRPPAKGSSNPDACLDAVDRCYNIWCGQSNQMWTRRNKVMYIGILKHGPSHFHDGSNHCLSGSVSTPSHLIESRSTLPPQDATGRFFSFVTIRNNVSFGFFSCIHGRFLRHRSSGFRV